MREVPTMKATVLEINGLYIRYQIEDGRDDIDRQLCRWMDRTEEHLEEIIIEMI
jgi:hypothetical protein